MTKEDVSQYRARIKIDFSRKMKKHQKQCYEKAYKYNIK